MDAAERARLSEQVRQSLDRYPAPSRHAAKAVASYNQVAGDPKGSALRELLGFDAYA